jgi:hypothetical protein
VGTVTILATAAEVGATITADTATGLKARAVGATITQKSTIANSKLVIGTATTLDLNSVGAITLEAGTNPGGISFAATSGKILIGAGTGGESITGFNGFLIGGKEIVNASLEAADFKIDSTVLVQIGGTTASAFTASTAAGQDVLINSTVVITDGTT